MRVCDNVSACGSEKLSRSVHHLFIAFCNIVNLLLYGKGSMYMFIVLSFVVRNQGSTQNDEGRFRHSLLTMSPPKYCWDFGEPSLWLLRQDMNINICITIAMLLSDDTQITKKSILIP